MKRNNRYYLRKIAGIPYLFPYGQTQADRMHGMKLNETGEFIWDRLAEECSEKELAAACAAHYDFSEEEAEHLKTDLADFLQKLSAHGLLDVFPTLHTDTLPDAGYLKIAGLNIRLCGPAKAFPRELDAFLTDKPARIHQTISLRAGTPRLHPNGHLLIRHKDLAVIDSQSHYVLLFPNAPGISEAHLSKDGSDAVFYGMPPFENDFKEAFFHAIRLVFLFLAGLHDMAALHSASLLYRERIWLFSGPSGTGKSTHTNLWHDLLQTPLVNGDLNLLAAADGRGIVHGIPWCGTSGIFDAHSHPLGGIILLKQAPEDHVEELPPDERILLVQQRLISPSWTEAMLEQELSLVEQLSAHTLICRLHCTISDHAVSVIKERIDRFLEES